jgi:YegS/Rv2252/BmrU family lipid kinase
MGTADVCVIFNPNAGRKRASQRFERLREVLGVRAHFRPTRGPGDGEELAYEAAREGFATVAAAGGDGTVHEVANGILRAGRPEVVLEVYPIGSANDYAHTLGIDPEWRLRDDPAVAVRAADVGVVRVADGRERYFVNGIGLGFNGQVNLEARRIRYLQGKLLYNLALLKGLCFRFKAPPMTVTMDGRERQVSTLALTLAIGRREGNFVLAPNAVLDDGLFDYLHAGALSRWELVRNLLGINSGHLPQDHPLLWLGRCKEVSVKADVPLRFHIDGELFCQPPEDYYSVQVSIRPQALRVMRKVQPAVSVAGSASV